MKQKRLFADPEPAASPAPVDTPWNIDNDQDWDAECFTGEDDPNSPTQLDHTVEDVRIAIKHRGHLSFKTESGIRCGIPVKLARNGPFYDIHLIKVFAWVGNTWEPLGEDKVIQGPLSGGKR